MDKRNLIVSLAVPIQLNGGHHKLMLELRREKERLGGQSKGRVHCWLVLCYSLLHQGPWTAQTVSNQMAELERKASTKSFIRKTPPSGTLVSPSSVLVGMISRLAWR